MMAGAENDVGAGMAWQDWPQRLSGNARQATEELAAGRPGEALVILDELMSDLAERRRIVADIANRRFEPSTDDRHE